ncbi:hypothetical protein BJ165DRAFT_308203 [Panaeolus papilionaceus]|nr:hypothetical protein BJ165DRAFT_308203 [Panaeolus papilionaceus]
MRLLLLLILHSFHYVYSLILTLRSFCQPNTTTPQPLRAPRRRVPKHLSILFVTDSTTSRDTCRTLISESVLNAVEWCRSIGISKLTVYEENDSLMECLPSIRESLTSNICDSDSSSDSDTEYPLTPPPSDYSESRPLSPSHPSAQHIPHTTLIIAEKGNETKKSSPALKHRPQSQQKTPCKPPVTLCIISRKSAKSAIANVATGIAQSQRSKRTLKTGRPVQPAQVTVDYLNNFLEDEEGLSSPDFMIIHPIVSSRFSAIPELHAFPPWQIRLTEICAPHSNVPLQPSWSAYNTPSALKEIEFRAALDEFASAEMRLGK